MTLKYEIQEFQYNEKELRLRDRIQPRRIDEKRIPVKNKTWIRFQGREAGGALVC